MLLKSVKQKYMDHLVVNLVVLSSLKLLLLLCYYSLICCECYDHLLFSDNFALIADWFCSCRFKFPLNSTEPIIQTAKANNHVHNILRLFDRRANFPFTKGKTRRDY